MKMKKIVMGLVVALFAINAMAGRILWKLEFLGEEARVENMNMSFIDFFENHTIPNRAATDGIDVVARSSSGVILQWMYVMEPAEDSFEDYYGPWLTQDGGGSGRAYTLIGNPQLILDDLPQGDSLQLLAGYFDWDNLDDSLPIDMASFTPFAVAEYSSDIFRGVYNPGDIAPPTLERVVSWNAVPEPSTAILALLGTCLLLKRRKTTHA